MCVGGAPAGHMAGCGHLPSPTDQAAKAANVVNGVAPYSALRRTPVEGSATGSIPRGAGPTRLALQLCQEYLLGAAARAAHGLRPCWPPPSTFER